MSDEAAESAAGARRRARRILNRNFVVYLCFVGALAAVMTVGLAASPGQPKFDTSEKAEKFAALSKWLKELLVLLFFSATIVSLGVRWSASILAARRFRRADPRRAARVFVVSQWLCFSFYGLFALAAFYYRMAAAGQWNVLVAATIGAALASFYFLKVPSYLLNAIFLEPGQLEGRREEGPQDESKRD